MWQSGWCTGFVLLFSLIEVHSEEDPVSTLLQLLDRTDPMVKEPHSHTHDSVNINSIFELFETADRKPMVVVLKDGKEPQQIDVGNKGKDRVIDMFDLSYDYDLSDDEEPVEQKAQKTANNILHKFVLSDPDPDPVIEEKKLVLREALRSRCQKNQQCMNKCKLDQCIANCKKVYDDANLCEPPKKTCAKKECGSCDEEDECETTTTKCPKKWFSTGIPKW